MISHCAATTSISIAFTVCGETPSLSARSDCDHPSPGEARAIYFSLAPALESTGTCDDIAVCEIKPCIVHQDHCGGAVWTCRRLCVGLSQLGSLEYERGARQRISRLSFGGTLIWKEMAE